MRIESAPIEAVAHSDILIVTASVPLSSHMTARMDLGPNVELFRQLIPLFSTASMGSEHIGDNPSHREIFNAVRNAGFDVYNAKGYANFAIAAATCEVVRAVVYDSHRTLPLSTYLEDWLGIRDNCFSIPVVIGRRGVIRHLRPYLNRSERKALEKAAKEIKARINRLLFPEPGRH